MFRSLIVTISLVSIVTLGGCAAQDVHLNDTTQTGIVGGSVSLVVQLGFIDQIRQLCAQSLLRSDFGAAEAYDQAVAQCTFDKLAILNINPVQSICNADVSALTPQQLIDFNSLCGAL